MPIKNVANRNQLKLLNLNELIDKENRVRNIDRFVKLINPAQLQFKIKGQARSGKPAYSERVLIAIYLYGYSNGIRSSRKLEQACNRNIELWWLTNYQKPCYKTIADFRKDNVVGFENLFKYFSLFCLEMGLFGSSSIAIDGSKFKAQNSKKNNYNLKKIDRNINYYERKEDEYLTELDENDSLESSTEKASNEKLELIRRRKKRYEALKEELGLSGETQISTTDADARALPLRMNIVEVGYNVQSIVDDKHNLILDYEVTNKGDQNALYELAKKGKEALGLSEQDSIKILADKGYATGAEIHKCHQSNMDTLIAPKKIQNQSKSTSYGVGKFIYDKEKDIYHCPAGNRLISSGKVYKYGSREIKKYRISYKRCIDCPFYNKCLSKGSQKNSQGKEIERSIYQNAVDKNQNAVKTRKAEYRRRQAIVEHPFGTIKRNWGYGYTLLKGKEKVSCEFALIFLCYNLKRVMTILGNKGLEDALKTLKSIKYVIEQLIGAHRKINCPIRFAA